MVQFTILNGNRDMIFYTQWYDAGIFKILDIVVNGRLANFEEISEKFGIPQRDRLKYYGLISMLPQIENVQSIIDVTFP